MALNIVLLEPEIPQNTGNIARTCAALGAVLHLIKPLGFSIDQASIRRAGLDYWDKLALRVHDNFEDFLQSIGRENTDKLWFFSTKSSKKYFEQKIDLPCFLVFGKETAGLPINLLERFRSQTLRVPMGENIRSLNLSNTVAIAAYDVMRQNNFPDLVETSSVLDMHHLNAKDTL